MINFTALALVASSFATCTLPSGDITDPHTWGNYFLDKYAAERAAAMNLDEPAPPPLAHPRTVLLITGVTIPAAWFDPIKARLERDGFRPVVYEPPDLLSGDLEQNAERLAHVVDEARAATGEERIDILAECTGGLIARRYIQALGGDAHVRSLVMFISPEHGVPAAATAAPVAGWPALYDLTPDSAFLNEVNDAPMSPDVPITSIYTCTDEYIQPYQTSIIPGATNIGIACDGSQFVGHFQFFYDPSIYLVMHDALVAPAPTDPTDPTPTPDPSTGNTSANDTGASGGCSAAGGGGGGFVVLAIGALLVLRRRRTVTVAALVVAAGCSSSSEPDYASLFGAPSGAATDTIFGTWGGRVDQYDTRWVFASDHVTIANKCGSQIAGVEVAASVSESEIRLLESADAGDPACHVHATPLTISTCASAEPQSTPCFSRSGTTMTIYDTTGAEFAFTKLTDHVP